MKNNDFLSDYEIKETIGKGTFSIVKLGINKITNEKVAIKILKKKKMQKNKDKLRLEREINILKRLHHINLIKIHKISEESDNYFIVMEYCENGELFNYIVAHERLSEEETAYFFYQLINGLDYIHHKNIVHRDLKPENLLLSQGNILKIVDFGLSNYYYPEEQLLSTPCGSPCYASPEMVCGNKYNGFKIDVWSCGIIIFAMICGYLPFEDPNNEILFKKIMKCKVDYPEYLSEEVLDILNKIIVIDPNKRINIEQIRQHPFYLKGKNEFKKKHKDLIEQVELIENNDSEDNNIEDDIVFNHDNFYDSGLNIKKSKSSNLLKEFDNKNDVHLFQFKKQLQKFKLDKNLIKKDNVNNSVKHKETINIKNKDKLKEALMNKFKMNNGLNKVLSNKIRLKETNEKINNSLKNIEKNIFERIDNKENINSEIYNSNALNDLSSFNTPLSDDLRMKYSEINSLEKKIFYSNSKNKVNLNILNQLLNKEKLEKYFDEKKLMIPKTQKNKDSLSYVLPYPQKKKSDILLPNKTEYKNKINNKSQKRLELIKFGISNKDTNDIFLYNTKNKIIEKNALTSVFNNKNLHIKNLRILNNNNYNNNVENITNINNVKNIIIYNNQNSPIKSIIKDVQYLTNANNDLPSINTKIIKENKILKSPTKDIKRTKIIKTNNIFIKNNNILIPKILLSKENSNVSLTKNYNTQNVNKLYYPSKNKKLNEIHKNLNKKNNQKLINKYKSSACSIDNIAKKAMNKKQISERTINSYGYGSDNSENNSLNKLHAGIYSVKNKNNLNKMKNFNIFNIKNNKDNMIILKKLNHTNK
jgi:5'-AMP-activated protein kinase catalytic alpha subunit